ncbi:hypothetical protein [Campylobacter rectus]|uniref:hypothetical protein n=1 Tax=Campylobacter rectus TaxID=203 RepID=UPI0021AB513D|nr:hypothetical protein [Campylobacter rectus]
MNVILRLGIIVLILYMALLALLYFFQERLIFFPSKLEPNYDFSFDRPFEEIRLDAEGAWISGLKFLADSKDGGQIYGDVRGEPNKTASEPKASGRGKARAANKSLKTSETSKHHRGGAIKCAVKRARRYFSTVTPAICKVGASMRDILPIWAMIFTCLATEATARAAAR